MCFACGQMLTPDRIKCPACGAPVKGSVPAKRSGRLTFAGFILAVFCLLSVITAVSILQNQEETARQTVDFSDARHAFTGYATALGGGNVTVTPDGDVNATVRAGTGGGFTVSGLKTGYHSLLFEASNHTSVRMHVVVLSDTATRLELQPGSGIQEVEHPTYRQQESIVRFGGGLTLAIAVLLAWASWTCFRRGTYGIALAGAIASILPAIPGFVMLPLAVIAIVLVVRGRKEFASRKRREAKASG